MLKPTNFHIADAQSSKENFKKNIAPLRTDWNEYGESDPGITVLELYAFFNQVTCERLPQMSEEIYNKFLKLLQVQGDFGTPSTGIVKLQSGSGYPQVLLHGTQMAAENLVFEACHSKVIYDESIVSLLVETSVGVRDCFSFWQTNMLHEPLFGSQPKPGNAFYIGLHKPLWNTTKHQLYFWLAEDGDRNPLGNSDFTLTQLSYFYYNGEAWVPFQVLSDETSGMLRSGFVTLALLDTMEACTVGGKTAYFIKAELQKGYYDVAPQLTDISLSVVKVAQRETAVTTLRLDGNGQDHQSHLLEHALAMTGKIAVEVQQENGDWISYAHQGQNQRCHIVVVDRTKPFILFDRALYGTVPAFGAGNIRITCTQGMYEDLRIISYGNGTIFQTFALDLSNLDVEQLALSSVERVPAGNRYTEWQRVEDLSNYGPTHRVYTLDLQEGTLRFGDGVHGYIPRKEERLELSQLAFTIHKNGNVKEREIHILNDENMAFVTVSNPQRTLGGRKPTSYTEMARNFSLEQTPLCRSVTRADYIQLLSTVPGFCLKCSAVWNYDQIAHLPTFPVKKEKNSIYLSILPKGPQEKELFDIYAKQLYAYLEDYRLLGTKHVILPYSFLDLEFTAIIFVKPYYKVVRTAFEEKIEAYFANMQQFGAQILSGTLYTILDEMDCVEYMETVHLDGAEDWMFDRSGNLTLPPHMLPRLKKINLEFRR